MSSRQSPATPCEGIQLAEAMGALEREVELYAKVKDDERCQLGAKVQSLEKQLKEERDIMQRLKVVCRQSEDALAEAQGEAEHLLQGGKPNQKKVREFFGSLKKIKRTLEKAQNESGK